MKILALDTSTEACSAALWLDGTISERFELAPRAHSQLILPMLDNLLEEAGLLLAQMDAIAFGCGPGSFTGVRMACSVAQGVAFGADLPVCPVSTLAALAQGTYDQHGSTHVLAAIDARMGEVYWGAYICAANGLMSLQGSEGVYAPVHVSMPEGGTRWFGAGTGWATYADAFQEHLGSIVHAYDGELYPHARQVASLGAALFSQGLAVSPEQAMPVYLRNEIAWKKQPQ